MAVLLQHQLLTRARVDLGMTQEEAARAVGVDVRTYRRYESGEVNEGGSFAIQRASRRQIIDRLCRELGLDAGELLRPAEERPPVLSTSLPRAQHFVGRRAELAHLRAWLEDRAAPARILAVIAMGGAGKTSLVERAVAQLGAPTPAPFVHSFYEQPSVDAFLRAAAAHLGQAGGEPLDDVLHGLRSAPGTVLVADGLEVVQSDGEDERARGELLDKRMVRLVRAVARDPALGRVLVTSRFSLVDLAAFEGQELHTLSLPPLDARESEALLRTWGAVGSSATISFAVAHTGGHALSLTVMASYAAELLGGDLASASQLELADAARDQPAARKLHAMLDHYASELAATERQLLGCVCLFPRGATQTTLSRAAAQPEGSDVELRAGLGRLVRRGLVLRVGERYSAHPFIRAHFARLALGAPAIHERERARLGELLRRSEHQLEGAERLDRAEELFEHTLLAGDAEGAFRVTQRTLGGFSNLGLRLGEFERGLRLMRALSRVAPRLPRDAQWRIAYDRGLYAAALGDLDAAVRAYRALLEEADDDATTHRTLAYTLRLRGELDLAHRHADRSIELGRRNPTTPGTVARGLALRGALLTAEGRLSEAGAAFDEVRASGDTPTARRSIWEAEYLLALGDVARAVSLTQQNLEACRERDWAGHVAHCHVILGRAAVSLGSLEEAEHALDAALDWCRRSREVELELESKLLELHVARSKNEAQRAETLAGALLDAAIAGGYGAIRAKLGGL